MGLRRVGPNWVTFSCTWLDILVSQIIPYTIWEGMAFIRPSQKTLTIITLKGSPQPVNICRVLRTGFWQVLHNTCMLASCVWLCDSMDRSPLGSSANRLFQARILEWVASSSSRGSSQPRNWTCISCLSCISRWTLYHWVTCHRCS